MVMSALVLVLLVVDWLSGGFLRAQVRSVGTAASRSLAAAAGAVQGSGAFASKASLEASNHALATELTALSERAAASDYLQQQNEELRTLVNLAQSSSGFTAPVVSSPTASLYGTFSIGVSSAQSVQRGDLVLTPGGYVVGAVQDVGGGTALVSELFAPGATSQAELDGAAVTVTGQGGGNARADAPRGLAVAVGDVVFSPQFGQRPIGVVGAVASSSASAAQTVYLRLPDGLAALQFVYVTPHDR